VFAAAGSKYMLRVNLRSGSALRARLMSDLEGPTS